MEHAGIDMAEHAVDEPAAVEGGAELGDVVGELLGGTAVSSTNGMGRRPPAMLPKSPTAFLRMPQMRSTGRSARVVRPMAILLGLVAVLRDAGAPAMGRGSASPVPRHREATAAARPALLLEERGHAFQLRRDRGGRRPAARPG